MESEQRRCFESEGGKKSLGGGGKDEPEGAYTLRLAGPR